MVDFSKVTRQSHKVSTSEQRYGYFFEINIYPNSKKTHLLHCFCCVYDYKIIEYSNRRIVIDTTGLQWTETNRLFKYLQQRYFKFTTPRSTLIDTEHKYDY